jgi:glycine cleavage system aminomethyltransferase T
MGSLSNAMYPEALRSIASTAVSATYAAVGTPLIHPIRIIRFTNASTHDITISWDGTTDHEYVVSGTSLLIDISTNREAAQVFDISQNTQFYVKGTTGTGNIYISAYYGK